MFFILLFLGQVGQAESGQLGRCESEDERSLSRWSEEAPWFGSYIFNFYWQCREILGPVFVHFPLLLASSSLLFFLDVFASVSSSFSLFKEVDHCGGISSTSISESAPPCCFCWCCCSCCWSFLLFWIFLFLLLLFLLLVVLLFLLLFSKFANVVGQTTTAKQLMSYYILFKQYKWKEKKGKVLQQN